MRSETKREIGVAILLFATALIVRVYFAYKYPLASDEEFYLNDARLIMQGLLPFRDFNARSPLFVSILAAAFMLFGIDFYVGRMTIILFSMATMAPLYYLGRKYFGVRAAQATLLMYGFIPLFAVNSYIVNTEPVVVFFHLTTLALVSMSESRGWDTRLLLSAGAVTALGVLVRRTSAFMAVAVVLYLIYRHIRRNLALGSGADEVVRELYASLRLPVIYGTASALLFIPAIGYLIISGVPIDTILKHYLSFSAESYDQGAIITFAFYRSAALLPVAIPLALHLYRRVVEGSVAKRFAASAYSYAAMTLTLALLYFLKYYYAYLENVEYRSMDIGAHVKEYFVFSLAIYISILVVLLASSDRFRSYMQSKRSEFTSLAVYVFLPLLAFGFMLSYAAWNEPSMTSLPTALAYGVLFLGVLYVFSAGPFEWMYRAINSAVSPYLNSRIIFLLPLIILLTLIPMGVDIAHDLAGDVGWKWIGYFTYLTVLPMALYVAAAGRLTRGSSSPLTVITVIFAIDLIIAGAPPVSVLSSFRTVTSLAIIYGFSLLSAVASWYMMEKGYSLPRFDIRTGKGGVRARESVLEAGRMVVVFMLRFTVLIAMTYIFQLIYLLGMGSEFLSFQGSDPMSFLVSGVLVSAVAASVLYSPLKGMTDTLRRGGGKTVDIWPGSMVFASWAMLIFSAVIFCFYPSMKLIFFIQSRDASELPDLFYRNFWGFLVILYLPVLRSLLTPDRHGSIRDISRTEGRGASYPEMVLFLIILALLSVSVIASGFSVHGDYVIPVVSAMVSISSVGATWLRRSQGRYAVHVFSALMVAMGTYIIYASAASTALASELAYYDTQTLFTYATMALAAGFLLAVYHMAPRESYVGRMSLILVATIVAVVSYMFIDKGGSGERAIGMVIAPFSLLLGIAVGCWMPLAKGSPPAKAFFLTFPAVLLFFISIRNFSLPVYFYEIVPILPALTASLLWSGGGDMDSEDSDSQENEAHRFRTASPVAWQSVPFVIISAVFLITTAMGYGYFLNDTERNYFRSDIHLDIDDVMVVGDYIRDHTAPDEEIFAWPVYAVASDRNLIMNMSHTITSPRNLTEQKEYSNEIIAYLEENSIRFVVDDPLMESQIFSVYPDIEDYVDVNYKAVFSYAGIKVLERVDLIYPKIDYANRTVEFYYKNSDALVVVLVGSFNNWEATFNDVEWQMDGPNDEGEFTFVLSLPPGTYGYRYLVKTRSGTYNMTDPWNRNSTAENSYFTVPVEGGIVEDISHARAKPEGELALVQGTVLFSDQGRVFVEDDSGGIWVDPAGAVDTAPSPGIVVEAGGRITSFHGMKCLAVENGHFVPYYQTTILPEQLPLSHMGRYDDNTWLGDYIYVTGLPARQNDSSYIISGDVRIITADNITLNDYSIQRVAGIVVNTGYASHIGYEIEDGPGILMLVFNQDDVSVVETGLLTIRAARDAPLYTDVKVRGSITMEPHDYGGFMLGFLQDDTAGIAFAMSYSTYDALEGLYMDSVVTLQGSIGTFNGLLMINISDTNGVVLENRTSRIEPYPASYEDIGEELEGRLVYIVGKLNYTADPDMYYFDLETEKGSVKVYLLPSLGIDPYSIATTYHNRTVRLTAIASQYDEFAPYDSGYELLPRIIGDFMLYG